MRYGRFLTLALACVPFVQRIIAEASQGASGTPAVCLELALPEHRQFCEAQRKDDGHLCEAMDESQWRGLCLMSRSPVLESCESLADENFLNYCYALKQKTSIPCFFITEPGLEFLCYSHVQNTPRFCADIADENLNQLCNALYAADKKAPRPPL